MEAVLDEIMRYDSGLRKIYRFKYVDAEGFYIYLHFTYDGFLIYIEIDWFTPSKLGFEMQYEHSAIVCNY
jgi:hypothetical protein